MTSNAFRAIVAAHVARRTADAAYLTDGRWSSGIACGGHSHAWADGGGAYGLILDRDGVPAVAWGDGIWPSRYRRVDLPADVLDMIEREYPMCAHVAGIPAADIGVDGDYVYVIDGIAYSC